MAPPSNVQGRLIIGYANENTVKLNYDGLGNNRYSINTDFFLVRAESDNTVRTYSVSTDVRLLQTSIPVLTLQTCWIQQTN